MARIQQQKVSSEDAYKILKICGREGTLYTELIDEIWTVLKNKVTLDVTHYNVLLKIYVEQEKDIDPVKILEEMVKAGIEPNR